MLNREIDDLLKTTNDLGLSEDPDMESVQDAEALESEESEESEEPEEEAPPVKTPSSHVKTKAKRSSTSRDEEDVTPRKAKRMKTSSDDMLSSILQAPSLGVYDLPDESVKSDGEIKALKAALRSATTQQKNLVKSVKKEANKASEVDAIVRGATTDLDSLLRKSGVRCKNLVKVLDVLHTSKFNIAGVLDHMEAHAIQVNSIKKLVTRVKDMDENRRAIQAELNQ